MIRRLEDHKRCGFLGFFCVHDFFPCSFSAESCTVNLLYGISKLPCKIDQRELECNFLPFKSFMLDTLTLEEQFLDSVLVLTVVIRQRLFLKSYVVFMEFLTDFSVVGYSAVPLCCTH